MHSVVEIQPIERFQDQIWELAQFGRHLDIDSNSELLTNPDTAALLEVMEDEVHDEPKIVTFYANAYNNYRDGDPDSVKEQLDIVRERVELMRSDKLFTPEEWSDVQARLESGQIVYDEARLFFKMFRHIIPANKVPNLHKMKGSERPTVPAVVSRPEMYAASKRLERRRTARSAHASTPASARILDMTSADPGLEREMPEGSVDFSSEIIAQAHQALLTIMGEKGNVKRNDAVAALNAKFDLNNPGLARKLVKAVYDYERNGKAPVFTQIRVNGAKVFARVVAGTVAQ